mgnify:CR=1 FL=1
MTLELARECMKHQQPVEWRGVFYYIMAIDDNEVRLGPFNRRDGFGYAHAKIEELR